MLSKIETLFRTEYRPLCIYAVHYLGSLDAAEDVVSSCFEALWEHLSGGAAVSNVRAYLYVSVRNSCLDHLKKNRQDTLDLDKLQPSDADGLITDEEAVDRSRVEARLWTAIDKMPARRREVLLLAKRDGLSYAEIASELGISENTVRNTLDSAMKSLRSSRREILDFVFCL
ncbi:MAG: sigma-70 family RNA polymerase sigma factor [Bacteroidales bacterium]|nr:sigma-70 family RNA polymerase sigma factor [Bacteroidales bacterium]